MKSILDLAYGVLAGRPEVPAARKEKAAGGTARNGAGTKAGKAKGGRRPKIRRGAPAQKKPRARVATRAR